MDRGDNNIVGVGSGGSGGSGGGGGGGIGLGVGCHVGNSGSPPNSTSSTHGTMHNSSGGFDGQTGDRGWEIHHIKVTRVPGYGFGIAVSGGCDNPHFTNGDPAIAISDVLKNGPAEGKLQVNDRIISANGKSLEGADYAKAVQVLRDSGSTVLLVVKRRAFSNSPSCLGSGVPQSHRLTLTRNNKKDDFGIVLGCRLYVKEVTRENIGVKTGDVLTRIGSVAADNMSLKEARKLMDQCKDRLSIVITRDNSCCHVQQQGKGDSGEYLSGASYSSQNLYVPPPTRQPLEDKSNLVPRGRSRGPLMDVSLSQLDLPATPTVDPPRPPPPRPEDYYSTRRQLYDEDSVSPRTKQPMPDPRFITFQKEGSVGVRLSGGNETGVFVTAVQAGSPASLQGLQPGDKILKINDMDMKEVTREEAVLFLLSLQEQIDLIVQHRRQEYDQIVASGRGDSFHIKTHFHYEQPQKGEMSFRSGDVFHVVDTLHNGVVGSWQVFRIGRNNQEVQKGIIPNKARAEELATAQFNATKKEMSANESRGSFFRRRRNSHRRSKSLGRLIKLIFIFFLHFLPIYSRYTVWDLSHPPVYAHTPPPVLPPLPLPNDNVYYDENKNHDMLLSHHQSISSFMGKFPPLPQPPSNSGVIQQYFITIFQSFNMLFVELNQFPEEALSDDFLFPMTSRLSYASSPESDLELSPAPVIPGTLGPPSRLKSSSDPSIATQDDTTAPPPYSTNYQQSFEQQKRRSQGVGDSKYGFSLSGQRSNQSGSPEYLGSSFEPRSPHHSPPDLPPRVDRNAKPINQTPRGTIGRSAQERLGVNKTDSILDMGNYINATPHKANATSSLERAQPKAGSYDSMSSYDSYNNTNGNANYGVANLNTSTGRLGPNVPDDLKTSNIPARAHDPYRFTRSTVQPISTHDAYTFILYTKYNRSTDYKSIPISQNKPPGTYKPIPPPKPKNYRPPQVSLAQTETNGNDGSNSYQHSKSYSIATSHVHNGVESNSNVQRNSGQYYYNIPPPGRHNDGNIVNSHHNLSHLTSPTHSHSLSHTHSHSSPPVTTTHSHSNSTGQISLGLPHNRNSTNHNGYMHGNNHTPAGPLYPSANPGHNREPSGLDLAGSREQRGSAFELYRKPVHHYNMR
ncbi:Tight junction protein ZO-1 [Trachymyrmex zeteki]|uniref:Tight junction protein ZO-1 n=1 Tax=Mycetomoellerius zeteki TaxID=64791 RepID=A0A151X8K9_9HYME|nr:Tight junction protein ZO-1 [Trachymyrmex zeteki]